MPELKAKLNLSEGNGVKPIVNLKQYDKATDENGKKLVLSLYDGALVYSIPDDAEVTIRGTKPDLTGYVYTCNHSGNTVTCNVEEQMTVIAGKHDAEIRITKDGNILGSTSFVLNVQASALKDNTKISETELPFIDKAIEDTKKYAEEATKQATASANSAKQSELSASGSASSASEAKKSETASASSATASANSASQSSDFADKAKQAYEQAMAIAGVGEFAYYIGQDGMLHFKFKTGGITNG